MIAKLKMWIFQSVFGYEPYQPEAEEQKKEPYDPILQELTDTKALLELKDKQLVEAMECNKILQELLQDKDSQPPEIHTVEVKVDHFTFTPESYRKFKRKLEAPVCSANTTPTQAAYFLGISRVLAVLEDEHVTNR